MKNIKKLCLLVALTTLSASVSNLHASKNFQQDDLYAKVVYRKMFDQTKTYKKYYNCFKKEGHNMKKLLTKPYYTFKIEEWVTTKIFHALTCNLLRKCTDKKEALGKKDDDIQPYQPIPTEDIIEEEETALQITYSSQKLDEILVNEFRRRKKKYMGKALCPVFSTCIFDTSTFIFSSKLMENKNSENKENFGSSFSMLIGIDIIRRNVKDFTSAILECISPSDNLDKYEELYARKKRFLDKNLQEKIEDKFATARKSTQSLDAIKTFLKTALSAPIKDTKLTLTRDIIGKIDKKLDGHQPPINKPIILDMYNHYNRYSGVHRVLKTPKTVLYLVGAGGTRKTYIVNQLAELMNADLITLKASSNPETLVGSDSKPGSFLEAISKPRMSRNAIIFIDEIDKCVNQENAPMNLLLPLLEPCEKYFYSPYLGCNIDISHFCFVLAGNNELTCFKQNKPKDKNSTDALNSRLNVVSVGKLTANRKKEIINELITEMLKNKDIDRESNSFQKLEEDIDNCIKKDKESGIRGAQRKVAALVNEFLFKQEFGNDWNFLKEPSEIITI